MSFLDLIEDAALLIEKADTVKAHAKDVAQFATSARDNVEAVRKLSDNLSERAKAGKKTGTLGFVFQVGRAILR